MPTPAMDTKTIGQWSDSFDLPNVAVHVSLLPNGKIFWWGRRAKANNNDVNSLNEHSTSTYLLEFAGVSTKGLLGANAFGASAATAKITSAQPPPKTLDTKEDVNLFCSGHCFQPDGKLLVLGGHIADGQGANQASRYNYDDGTWESVPQMIAGRWYPSGLVLRDGRMLCISGSDLNYHVVNTPQILCKDGWMDAPSPPDNVLILYPRLHLSPDGRVFMAGPQMQSMFLNVNATATDDHGKKVAAAVEWTPGPKRTAAQREYAPSVMYDSGKIMYIGGGIGDNDTRTPTNMVEFINLKDAVPAWTTSPTSDMKFKRQQHNGTVLPDGTVLVTGGSQGTGWNNLEEAKDGKPGGPVHVPELWDPATGKWTEMADEQIDRCYHSTALLLPDGQVLSAGGGEYDTGRVSDPKLNITRARLFKPPYLFKTRPTVLGAPSSMEYGKDFPVTVGTGDSIAKASLVRLGSVTHANNFNQSLIFLSCKQSGSTVTVQPPALANANEAPPGHYMLFLLNQERVPSVAPIIRLGPVPAVPLKPVLASAQRPVAIVLSNAELDKQILTKQTRPAVAVGLTPACYYGLGPCWGGAYDALQRMSDIEVVRPVPSQADSVAFVYLKKDILPDIDKWRKEFASTAKGAYEMRGIEMTLSGAVARKRHGDDQELVMIGTEIRPEVRLAPFKDVSQIKWDLKAKSPKAISEAEARAYTELFDKVGDAASNPTVEVTGWLQKQDGNKFSLHVRKFAVKKEAGAS